MLFQQIKANRRVGGVDVGVTAVVVGTVELFFPLNSAHAIDIRIAGFSNPGAFCELAKIVQVGCQCHPAGGVQSFRIHCLLRS